MIFAGEFVLDLLITVLIKGFQFHTLLKFIQELEMEFGFHTKIPLIENVYRHKLPTLVTLCVNVPVNWKKKKTMLCTRNVLNRKSIKRVYHKKNKRRHMEKMLTEYLHFVIAAIAMLVTIG